MDYVIESGIPLPKRTWGKPSAETQNRSGNVPVYPLAEMKVGDSFVFHPRSGESADTALRRMAGSAGRWGKNRNRNIKFALRCLDAQTIRIWRVA